MQLSVTVTYTDQGFSDLLNQKLEIERLKYTVEEQERIINAFIDFSGSNALDYDIFDHFYEITLKTPTKLNSDDFKGILEWFQSNRSK